ncbi:MAG: ATP-binding protein [Dehalococcoidia bacterium]
MKTQIVDAVGASLSFPAALEREVSRENLLTTLADLFEKGTNTVVVEGDEGSGKTVLLSQFARQHPNRAISLFIRPINRLATNPRTFKLDLAGQIYWILQNDEMSAQDVTEHDFPRLLHQLQRRAKTRNERYYFVVDGVHALSQQDELVTETLFQELLHFSVPEFRFLLSGTVDDIPKTIRDAVNPKNFPMHRFLNSETEQYFDDLDLSSDQVHALHRVCSKGFPAYLASIRRELRAGAKVEELLDADPTKMPDFLALEWQRLAGAAKEEQLLLAGLAFDHSDLSIQELASAVGTSPEAAENLFRHVPIIEVSNGRANYLTDSHRRFAQHKLSHLTNEVTDRFIDYLTTGRPTSQAATSLADYYRLAGRFDELVHYLTPEVFSQLLASTNSLYSVRQQTDVGLEAAKKVNVPEAVMAFSLQSSALAELSNIAVWRSEVEARVALKDYDAAITLAQSAVLLEDRLELLAAITRVRLEQGLAIEPDLVEQVRSLVVQIDLQTLGSRATAIAADLVRLDADLAIRVIEAKKDQDDPNALDWALAKLSTAALSAEPEETESREAVDKVRSRIASSEVQDFLETVTLLVQDYSAADVIKRAEAAEAKNRLMLLRRWTAANADKYDAGAVIKYALDLLVKSSDKYVPKMRDLRELAMPLKSLGDKRETEELVQKFDAIKGPMRRSGATVDHIRLELSLAEAEVVYSEKAAGDRIQDLLQEIWDLADVSVRARSLSFVSATLERLETNPDVQALRDLGREKLWKDIDYLLANTAQQFELTRGLFRSLSRQDPEVGLELAGRLNTVSRRDKAYREVVVALLKVQPEEIEFEVLSRAIDRTSSPSVQGECLLRTLDYLAERPASVQASQLNTVLTLVRHIRQLPPAVTRCQCLVRAIAFLKQQSHRDCSTYLENLMSQLGEDWESIDVGWLKLDTGFDVATVLADIDSAASRDYLSRAEKLRSNSGVTGYQAARMSLTMLRLLMRAFAGLLPTHAYEEEDLLSVERLMDLIPAKCERIALWSELVQRAYLLKKVDFGRHIVTKHIRPLLETIPALDAHAYHVAIVAASPALFVQHADTALELLRDLPISSREEAYRRICFLLLLRCVSGEPYRDGGYLARELKHEVAMDLCRVLELMERDSSIAEFIPIFAKSLEEEFVGSREQRASITQRLQSIVSEKLPDKHNITHDGYQILLQAYLLLPDQSTKGPDWEDLISRAKGISNGSDRAYVLSSVAALLPGRHDRMRPGIIQEALAAIKDIRAELDKAERYFSLAAQLKTVDRGAAKECLRQAYMLSHGPDDRRRRLQESVIDIAHGIDAEFANSLITLADDDPARSRNGELKEYLNVLDTRQRMMQTNRGTTKEQASPSTYAHAAWMNLGSLNAGRFGTVHSEALSEYIEASKGLALSEAYPLFAWAIENTVLRHSHNPERREQLSGLYRGIKRATQVVLQLADMALRGSPTNLGTSQSTAELSAKSRTFGLGQKEEARSWLTRWLELHGNEYLIVCDPYFGPNDLDLLTLVNSVNPGLKVRILTSGKHLNNLVRSGKVREPMWESFDEEWERLSDQEPPPTKIVIAGVRGNQDLPIHDRWWLTKGGGLRHGTSFHSLGATKVSEISVLSMEEASVLERDTVSPLLNEDTEYQGLRVRYNTITL